MIIPSVNCCGIRNRRFVSIFCLLIIEIKILIINNVIRYRIKVVVSVPRKTITNPTVVMNQNRKANSNEFPKKDIAFFENPFTESLNP